MSWLRLATVLTVVSTCLWPSLRLHGQRLPIDSTADAQPLVSHALRLAEALQYLGNPLRPEDAHAIAGLKNEAPSAATVRRIQRILDPYVLAMAEINPESRVKVVRGPAPALLTQDGWTSFLVKVHNQAGINPELEVASPNAEPILHVMSAWKASPTLPPGSYPLPPRDAAVPLSPGELAHRFLYLEMYRQRPLLGNLSGQRVEYAVMQVYARETGAREARIGFHVGQGTQDIGFRNDVAILFEIRPSVKVTLRVKDYDGSPTMGSFTITDGIDRLAHSAESPFPNDYRNGFALVNSPGAPYTWPPLPDQPELRLNAQRVTDSPGIAPKRLMGIYPLPSRRLASRDEYPDFYFQAQIYRADGEHVYLPPGTYTVEVTRGPEYLVETRTLYVPAGAASYEATFRLKRWVDLATLGWFSADHHVHGAGCSHYESPEQGVPPGAMWRQALGEALSVTSVLSWGPGWYHQKQFFTGKEDSLSTARNVIRYDVEVSGFPSQRTGHLILTGLKEDDYPGTTTIEDWPSWGVPILRWAKSQGALTGYAHSGSGLEPTEPSNDLPNYVLPKMNGNGAQEYVVAATEGLVDVLSIGDTPFQWELNLWYHMLNVGFRTRLVGETDFPCITHGRVGLFRTYAKLDGPLTFDAYLNAARAGRSYVSDGRSHIVDFSINGFELGKNASEFRLHGPATASVSARVTALLPELPDTTARYMALGSRRRPYWDLEHARIAATRKVPVELIVNGEPVATSEIEADGNWSNVRFDYQLTRSSWIALRILPSAHTNPIFAIINDAPVRASRRSAEWVRQAVDQVWKMKSPGIRTADRAEAERAYDQARQVYDRLIAESAN